MWRQAPVGLALLRGGCLEAWNPSACRLLETAVGGSPLAWQRWLEAAALRLATGGGPVLVLEGPRRQAPALEIATLGQATAAGDLVVSLRAATEASDPAARAGERGLVETVSTLSHELRTPLAAMKGSLSLVLGGDAGPLNAEQARFLGVALRNVTRLDRLVGDLLDIACDDAGHLSVDCRPADLGPLLREALALFEDGTGTRGPRVDATGIPEHFTACVDADKLVQIVSNLVGNARKYVPQDGRVRVWLDPHPSPIEPLAAELARACGMEARTFTLVVEDNGPGIDPHIVDRVFEPFERGRAEVIGRIGGAGLGLHIVRRLAEAHGGKVSLATAPGAGTTIWVRLPSDPAAGRLLKAVVQLHAALDQNAPAPGAGCGVALLDCRGAVEGAGAALAAGRSLVEACAACVVGRPCEPAPGVLAVAVTDLALWNRSGRPQAAGWRQVGTAADLIAPVSAPITANRGKPGTDRADAC